MNIHFSILRLLQYRPENKNNMSYDDLLIINDIKFIEEENENLLILAVLGIPWTILIFPVVIFCMYLYYIFNVFLYIQITNIFIFTDIFWMGLSTLYNYKKELSACKECVCYC